MTEKVNQTCRIGLSEDLQNLTMLNKIIAASSQRYVEKLFLKLSGKYRSSCPSFIFINATVPQAQAYV